VKFLSSFSRSQKKLMAIYKTRTKLCFQGIFPRGHFTDDWVELQKEKGIDGSMTVLFGGTYAC
jgi:hypothetical protein